MRVRAFMYYVCVYIVYVCMCMCACVCVCLCIMCVCILCVCACVCVHVCACVCPNATTCVSHLKIWHSIFVLNCTVLCNVWHLFRMSAAFQLSLVFGVY